MNPIEEHYESRLPSIENLKLYIQELQSLNLENIAIKNLADKINEYFPLLNFGEVLWDNRYHIYRVRRNKNNLIDRPFNSVEEIGLPPSQSTPFGRANNEFKPIFYGSNTEDLTLFESCQNLTESDRYTPQSFTMGIWSIKEPIRLAPIIDNSLVIETRDDIQIVLKERERIINKGISSTKFKETTKLISTFFADQFAKAPIQNHHDYKISAFFANCIEQINQISTVKFDGLLYPSVAYKFRDDNVAIFKESVSKLQLVKSYSVVCYNFDFEAGTVVKGILREGKIQQDNTIVW